MTWSSWNWLLVAYVLCYPYSLLGSRVDKDIVHFDLYWGIKHRLASQENMSPFPKSDLLDAKHADKAVQALCIAYSTEKNQRKCLIELCRYGYMLFAYSVIRDERERKGHVVPKIIPKFLSSTCLEAEYVDIMQLEEDIFGKELVELVDSKTWTEVFNQIELESISRDEGKVKLMWKLTENDRVCMEKLDRDYRCAVMNELEGTKDDSVRSSDEDGCERKEDKDNVNIISVEQSVDHLDRNVGQLTAQEDKITRASDGGLVAVTETAGSLLKKVISGNLTSPNRSPNSSPTKASRGVSSTRSLLTQPLEKTLNILSSPPIRLNLPNSLERKAEMKVGKNYWIYQAKFSNLVSALYKEVYNWVQSYRDDSNFYHFQFWSDKVEIIYGLITITLSHSPMGDFFELDGVGRLRKLEELKEAFGNSLALHKDSLDKILSVLQSIYNQFSPELVAGLIDNDLVGWNEAYQSSVIPVVLRGYNSIVWSMILLYMADPSKLVRDNLKPCQCIKLLLDGVNGKNKSRFGKGLSCTEGLRAYSVEHFYQSLDRQ